MLTQRAALFKEDREREKRSRIFGTPEFRSAYYRQYCAVTGLGGSSAKLW